MQVRYQAALRPETADFTLAQGVQHVPQFALERGDVRARRASRGAGGPGHRRARSNAAAAAPVVTVVPGQRVVETIARPADGEAFLVEQLADAPDQQHLVVLVIAPVAAPLDRFELRKLLLPIAQDVRLHPAEIADFTDGEVALRSDRRKINFPAVWLHGATSRPWLSASGWRGR